MKQVYMAIGPFCWGKADDIETAIKRAKYNWIEQYSGKFDRKKFTIYMFVLPEGIDDSAIIFDSDGMMRWPTTVPRYNIQMYPEGEEIEDKKLGQKKG